jgi:hypothetical protein
MSAANDFYVYALFRADRVTPFYVGKGRGDRVHAHSRPSELARGKGRIKEAIARKVVAAIGHVPHRTIFSGLGEHEALSAEAGLIAALGRISDGSGVLANMTDGGEGASGNKQSAEDRAKKRESAMKRETRAKKSAALVETYSRPDVRAKLVEAQARIRSNSETAAKLDSIRVRLFARPGVQERRKANAAAALGKAEVRKKLADAQLRRWSDPAARAAQSEAAKAAWAKRKAASSCA